jgi:hypothetical protein
MLHPYIKFTVAPANMPSPPLPPPVLFLALLGHPWLNEPWSSSKRDYGRIIALPPASIYLVLSSENGGRTLPQTTNNDPLSRISE